MRPDPAACAAEWIAAWNVNDPEAVLAHYADDIVFVTPRSIPFTGDPTSRVVGKAALREYWGRALQLGGVHFTLRAVYSGPDGVAIRYHSSRTGADVCEVMRFDDEGLVRDSAAFYE